MKRTTMLVSTLSFLLLATLVTGATGCRHHGYHARRGGYYGRGYTPTYVAPQPAYAPRRPVYVVPPTAPPVYVTPRY